MNDTVRTDDTLITTRVFSAPIELVFDTWTDPVHLARWFGPDGFTISTEQFSLKIDGEWRFMMHGPDRRDYPNIVRYKNIERPHKLEYLQMGDESVEDIEAFYVEITFSEVDGKTKMIMKMTFKTKEDLDHVIDNYGALEGQKQTLSRLERYLTSLTK